MTGDRAKAQAYGHWTPVAGRFYSSLILITHFNASTRTRPVELLGASTPMTAARVGAMSVGVAACI